MTETLYVMALLACPVGMGTMMWFMMRGKTPPDPPSTRDPELEQLRREVDELRAAQHDRDPGITSSQPGPTQH